MHQHVCHTLHVHIRAPCVGMRAANGGHTVGHCCCVSQAVPWCFYFLKVSWWVSELVLWVKLHTVLAEFITFLCLGEENPEKRGFPGEVNLVQFQPLCAYIRVYLFLPVFFPPSIWTSCSLPNIFFFNSEQVSQVWLPYQFYGNGQLSRADKHY